MQNWVQQRTLAIARTYRTKDPTTQVEDVRPDPANFPQFPEAGFRNRFRAPVPIDFRQIPSIQTLIMYPFVVSQAVPVSPNDDRIQARFPSDPVRILNPGSDRL